MPWEAFTIMGLCFGFGFLVGAARARHFVLRHEIPRILAEMRSE